MSKLLSKEKVYYLASPHSHPLPNIMDNRYHAAVRATGWLFENGFMAMSPIAHSHVFAKTCSLPKEFNFFRKFDTRMMKACDGLLVLTLPGWEKSIGVTEEITFFHKVMHIKPIFMRYTSFNYKFSLEP